MGAGMIAFVRPAACVAGLLLASTPAVALPPEGLSPAQFQSHRIQNMVDRANGQGAACPPVRLIDCAPLPEAQRDTADARFACNFQERVGKTWVKAGGTLARLGGQWDFNTAALRRCTYK